MARQRPAATPEALTVLNRVISACSETRELIQKCKNCGIDVDKEERRNAEQLAFAQKLKREFYPTAT